MKITVLVLLFKVATGQYAVVQVPTEEPPFRCHMAAAPVAADVAKQVESKGFVVVSAICTTRGDA